jgi:large subunit ribosomal protein L6
VKTIGKMFVCPSRGKALERAITSSSIAVLLPTHTAIQRRQFSVTPSRPSKLGRTPISIPPGVELTIGEPRIKKDATTYLQTAKSTVTVEGPLG